MRYFLIAGEASGDLHGMNLINAIKDNDSEANFRFWGGDKMAKASCIAPVKHIKELAIMGFLDVVKNISSIKKNFAICKKQIAEYEPDAVIFIDYPGFNLRIAPFVKSLGISTFYYISPKVWAWKKNRVFKIKKSIDILYSILPFETEFYNQFDYPIIYIGNPLMDAISDFKERNPTIEKRDKTIAIIPGSRKQELSRMLPIMIEVADSFPNYNFVIAGAPNFEENFYHSFFKKRKYPIEFDNTYEILSSVEAAMVTSGTASLETALFDVPQVVCYKTDEPSYQIGKRLVKLKYMSLVNLILDKLAVVELLQHKFSFSILQAELKKIIIGGELRESIFEDHKLLREKVGGAGASQRAAKSIVDYLNKRG